MAKHPQNRSVILMRGLVLVGVLCLVPVVLIVLRPESSLKNESGNGTGSSSFSNMLDEEEPIPYDENLGMDHKMLIWAQVSLKDPNLTMNDLIYDPSAHDDYLFHRFLQKLSYETGVHLQVEDFDSALTLREFSQSFQAVIR